MNRCAVVLALFLLSSVAVAQPVPDRELVTDSLHRAVAFFRQHASAGGGYIFQLSADLKQREGEGKVSPTIAWIEPPATPVVGTAYLDAYRICGDSILLDAAQETAGALIRGQLRSGGWDNMIEFDPEKRRRYAYRTESSDRQVGRNITTFDDDKTQSAIRFLVQLDKELEFEQERLHEAALYALEGVLEAQYPCGAWPQRFGGDLDNPDPELRNARFPEKWSREYPGARYDRFYTLNDNTINDLIVTLLDAWEVYDDDRYLKAAQRGGDFLLLAQLPEPQPGWAQQYNREMEPAWARKFEPPAITGGESQGVMRTLIELYRRTAATDEQAKRFLKPLPRAIEYYRNLLLPDGRLARFYEIGTDRPLYFTRDYKLTYDNSDMPMHYGFITGSSLDSIERQLMSIQQMSPAQLRKPDPTPRRRSDSLNQHVRRLVDELDDRGAWVEPGRLKYHGDDDPTRQVIRSATFSKNIISLAKWLHTD